MAEIKINMDSLKTYRKAVRHKIKEGSNIYRFLPPFGDNCDGYPYAFWAISWGLSDPSTGNRRPYSDCKREEGKSPIWEYLDLLRVKVEKIKIELVAAGKSEEEIKERLKLTNKFISDLRPKTAFAWNAIDKSGTVGILEVKSTAHKQVLKLMNQYILDYNQDPTSLGGQPSDSGVWFDISRTGMSFDTEYAVKKNQVMIKDPVTGVPSYTDDRSEIPESVAADYQNMGYDLTTIYQKKSYDELKEILMANIQVLSQTNSDLYVEEFAIADGKTNPGVAAPDAVPASTPVQESKPVVPQGAGNVALKLGNTEENQMEVPQTPAETAPPIAAKDETSVDDMMAMAENIFNQ